MEGIKRATVTPADASLLDRSDAGRRLSSDAGLVFFSMAISCKFPPSLFVSCKDDGSVVKR